MFVYDPEEDSWSERGEIPEGVNHAGFVAVNDRLYIVGGYREATFEPVGAVHIYDVANQTWSQGASMPTPRGALAYTVLEGRIHTIGGTIAPPEDLEEGEEGYREDRSVGVHEVYDPTTDSWEQRAPMPTPRNHHAAAATDGRIYVTAGRASTNFTMTQTEVYDPETDRWRGAAPLPTGRSGVAAVALDGWIYLFGGETFDPGDERTFDAAERYDPQDDRWEVLPPMPSTRHGLGAAVVGSDIYVVSGGPEPGFSFGTANERLTPEQ
jgi:N-acetylneuraminic acid mutarotase